MMNINYWKKLPSGSTMTLVVRHEDSVKLYKCEYSHTLDYCNGDGHVFCKIIEENGSSYLAKILDFYNDSTESFDEECISVNSFSEEQSKYRPNIFIPAKSDSINIIKHGDYSYGHCHGDTWCSVLTNDNINNLCTDVYDNIVIDGEILWVKSLII